MNSQLDLECLPQRTTDAVSYGILKPIVAIANELARGNMIYLTGGDGAYLEKFFSHALYERDLVFAGMRQVINENKEKLCLE
jgi:type III pantothenate kinase